MGIAIPGSSATEGSSLVLADDMSELSTQDSCSDCETFGRRHFHIKMRPSHRSCSHMDSERYDTRSAYERMNRVKVKYF